MCGETNTGKVHTERKALRDILEIRRTWKAMNLWLLFLKGQHRWPCIKPPLTQNWNWGPAKGSTTCKQQVLEAAPTPELMGHQPENHRKADIPTDLFPDFGAETPRQGGLQGRPRCPPSKKQGCILVACCGGPATAGTMPPLPAGQSSHFHPQEWKEKHLQLNSKGTSCKYLNRAERGQMLIKNWLTERQFAGLERWF